MQALWGRNNPLPVWNRLGTCKNPISYLRNNADKAGKTRGADQGLRPQRCKTMKKRNVIILRVSETLASELAREADELGISRNALIVLKLQKK
jgi:hypothetical protein